MGQQWTEANIPPQAGRTVIVTGATSGIGRQAARALAEKGARVIIAARNIEKADRVARDIRAGMANDGTNNAADISTSADNMAGELLIEKLDLASLSSIRDFAEKIASEHSRLDMLINNAGVMFCPLSRTQDGFEQQIGVNHLGHFALTGLLLPMLKQTTGSRVISVASLAHKGGKIDLDDLNWENRDYSSVQAYCDSKLANLLFMNELNRRLKGQSADPIAVAAHPGWTSTELQRHSTMTKVGNFLFGQKASVGALPTLRAATGPTANMGAYFGPRGLLEMRGLPVKVSMEDKAKDEEQAGRLWTLSEQLTGITY